MSSRISRALAVLCVSALAGAGLAVGSVPAPAEAAGTATLSLYKAIENLATGASEGDRSKWDVQAMDTATGDTIVANGLNGFQTRVIPSGTYTISELDTARTPPGYAFRDWNCAGTVYTSPSPTITLADGQNLTCTVTNVAVQSTLTLRKNVVGGSAPASMWTLRAQGPTNINGTANTAAVTNQPVRIGNYQLSESGPGAAQGYTASAWSCTWTDHLGNTGTLAVDASGNIAVDIDRAITCTITNTSSLPQLTLVKQVVSPTGPAAPASSWTLSATPSGGGAVVSGTSGSPQVSHVTVDANADYTLAESGPAGYTSSGWSCVAASGTIDSFTGTVLNLGPSADVTCTITNTFAGGTLTLAKQVVDSTQPRTDWTLTATGTGSASGTVVQGATGDASVTSVPVPAGDYTLSESGPGGYLTDGYVCNGGSPGYAVTVAPGADVSCTITNTRETTLTQLTLVKQVDNTGGGPYSATSWGLRAAGPTTISGRTGLSTVTYAIIVPGHYTLTEQPLGPDPNGDFARYASAGWSCTDSSGASLPLTGAGANEVDIAEGLQVTCTVRNVWTGAAITFTKQVENGAYGAHTPDEWNLAIQPVNPDGSPIDPPVPPVLTGNGAGGAAGIENQQIAPGTYRLVEEAGGPAGYAGPFFHCVGDAGPDPDDDLITVASSTVVTCTATNTALAPQLTLRKALDNTGGGTATVADFTLKARGPGDAAISGPSSGPAVTDVPLPAGEYVFSEDGPSGYDVDWDCTGGAWDDADEVATLDAGEDMVCTATNTVVRPTLTLAKTVAGGGPATVADWTLSADGPGAPISGVTGDPAVTGASVDAGVYELSEAPAAGAAARTAGYEQGAWSCTAGTLSGSELTLSPGQNASCTVTNDWTGGTLTLVKEVDDGQLTPGGGGTPADWTLHAVGPATVEGPGGSAAIVSQPVPPGDYALSESLTAGPVDPDYRPGEWVCTGTGFTFAPGSPGEGALSIQPGAGADVTCTLVNLYRPPHLTLRKAVVGGGPLADGADWTLAFAGPSSGSGVTGDAAITGVAVGSGTFALSETASDPAFAAGYAPGAWSCTGGTVSDHGDGTAELQLAADDLDVVCTIQNSWTGSTLTLVKEVDDGGETPADPGDPGDWTLSAAGPTALSGVSGTSDVSGRFVLPGSYGLAETLTGSADPEYRPADWACTAAAGVALTTGELGSGTAQLAIDPSANADVVCTLVNQFRPPHVTLVKQLTGGGPLALADWTLSLSGGAHGVDLTAPADSPVLVDHAVGEGVFTLSEAPSDPSVPTAGYTTTGWSCDGGALTPGASPGTATLALDADADSLVTCTITNSWTGSRLALSKQVDDGSVPPDAPNAPTDWTLSAVGPAGELHAAGSGAAFLAPGQYALSEAPSAGATIDPDYRPGAWSCTSAPGVSLVPGPAGSGSATLTLEPGAGADVACTLTNSFLPPHLTLAKQVVGGGPRPAPSDWPLSFDNPASGRSGSGVTGDAAVTGAAVGSGLVTLAETPDPGYVSGSWSCTGTAGTPSATVNGVATILLAPDDAEVSCTITNTFAGAQLTLGKQVEDGGLVPGAPGAPEDWTLSAVGAGGEMHVPGGGSAFLPAGDYTLGEAANTAVDPDYRPAQWQCEPAGALTPGAPGTGSVHLEPGSAVSCTLANLFRPPHLTLTKVVQGGPLASTADWTLTFANESGTVSGIGRSGDPAITGVAVGAGSYRLMESPTDPSVPATGYTSSGWSCDGTNAAVPATDGSATIALEPGDLDVHCTITNTWSGGTLTLVKHVEGGTAAPGDWTLSADGPTPVSGTSGETAVTGASVLAGGYTLSESPSASSAALDEYAPGSWSCTGGPLDGDTVTVATGAQVSCTITNTFDPPTLTLVKRVLGAASPAAWTLSADGPTPIAGTSGDPLVTSAVVRPGSYTLSETALPGQQVEGYVSDGWSCAGAALNGTTITLGLGDRASCTVTNRDPGAYPHPGLVTTGAELRGWLLGALVALLFGAVLLLSARIARRRRS